MSATKPLRIGILGAARIAPTALLRPARELPEVEVAAVAARDPKRASAFARKHGISSVHPDYDSLLYDRSLDAVYNPLPNGLHCEWTIRALEAGKHVLCEKPMASNAVEAERMAEAAEKSGLALVEAFHWRHHPLAARMREVVRNEIGRVRHLEASLCVPILRPGDIRYRFDLSGGATMDMGCYVINIVRWLAEAEPSVVSARARLSSADVDRFMRAELRFADGRTARITCGLLSSSLLRLGARVEGSAGTMRVFNAIAPQYFHRLTVRTKEGVRREKVAGDASYTHQLRAFARHVRAGEPITTDAWDAVANMRVVDAVYRKAGLPLRGT
jgi:predicted dehydrogenase